MNCRNCGGAMELFGTRGCFFCRYCGSFHFPETAADEGVRVLEDSPDPMACASCARSLASALLDEIHPVHYCRNCRGVLSPRTTFAGIVQKRRAWATTPPAPPVPLDRKGLDRRVVCPACRRGMETHPYYGPGNVIIDSCAACDLVWLDFGELTQIVDAPGRDRGSRELVPAWAMDRRGADLDRDDDDDVDPLELLTRLF